MDSFFARSRFHFGILSNAALSILNTDEKSSSLRCASFLEGSTPSGVPSRSSSRLHTRGGSAGAAAALAPPLGALGESGGLGAAGAAGAPGGPDGGPDGGAGAAGVSDGGAERAAAAQLNPAINPTVSRSYIPCPAVFARY